MPEPEHAILDYETDPPQGETVGAACAAYGWPAAAGTLLVVVLSMWLEGRLGYPLAEAACALLFLPLLLPALGEIGVFLAWWMKLEGQSRAPVNLRTLRIGGLLGPLLQAFVFYVAQWLNLVTRGWTVAALALGAPIAVGFITSIIALRSHPRRRM